MNPGALIMPYEPPQPGTALSRGWLIRLWQALLQHTRLVAGPGIQVVAMPGGGYAISLDSGRVLHIPARVTTAPAFAPTAPASCVYTVQAYGKEALTLTAKLPALGRPTANDEWMLWPARVGDPCTIVRTRDAAGAVTDRLWIATEAIAAKPCG